MYQNIYNARAERIFPIKPIVLVALTVEGNLGYVHTGPVLNGSDPILERTISVTRGHRSTYQRQAT